MTEARIEQGTIVVEPSQEVWQAACGHCGNRYAAVRVTLDGSDRFRYCAMCGEPSTYYRLDPST